MGVLARAGVAEAVHAVLRRDLRDVAVEAELRLGLRVALRPHELLHAELRRDPRTARRRIAGTVVDAELESEPLRLGDGELDHLPPLRAHVLHAGAERSRHALLAAPADVLYVEDGRSGESGVLHRLEVARDAVLRDVRALPVPPHVRAPPLRRGVE